MKSTIGLSAMVFAATLISAPVFSQESGKAPTDSLVLYSSHPIEMVDYYISAFEAENPGVKVDLITGGTGELLSRIKAEAGRPLGDVLWGGGAHTGSSAPELFNAYDSPVLSEIFPEFLDPAGFNAPPGAFTMVIVYNKDLVSDEDAPKTWAELADAKWSGKIQYANPASSSSSYAALVAWKEIGGWELVEAMAKNMTIVDSSSGPFTAVGNGEVELGVAYEEGAHRWLASGKVGIVYPSDGVTLLAEGLFRMKDGPNEANADKFADFILSQPQQQALVDNFPGRRPTNVNVSFPDSMPSANDLNVLPYPADAVTDQSDWLAKWKDIMINTR